MTTRRLDELRLARERGGPRAVAALLGTVPHESWPGLLSVVVAACVDAIRTAQRRTGTEPGLHLEELRRSMLRRRRPPLDPMRRDEIEYAVAVLASQLGGHEVVVHLDRSDRAAPHHRTRRLLLDLVELEHALGHAVGHREPAPAA